MKKLLPALLTLYLFPAFLNAVWSKRPDDVDAKIALGYWQLNNKKQARVFIDKALVINPQNEEALELKSSIK